MIQNILIFLLFLCPLIFFHELGHFLFARLFGVRVEVFSLGFGPKLFKFKKGDTEYAFSVIPLGGYVKMFGDDPLNMDAIKPEERKHSFTHKGKWARFWIVFGGPLANFIMAFVIFFFLFLVGEKIPEFRFGSVPKDSILYEKGIRSGDVLKKVNGQVVYNPSDVAIKAEDPINSITILRRGKQVVLNPEIKGRRFFNAYMKHNRPLRRPVVSDMEGNEFAVSLEKGTVNPGISLDQMADMQGNKELFFYPALPRDERTKNKIAAPRADGKGPVKTLTINSQNRVEFFQKLREEGYRPNDLLIKSIERNSPADKAGVKGRDVIIGINGHEVQSFDDFREKVQSMEEEKAEVTLWHEGKEISLTLTPELTTQGDRKVKLIGVYSAGDFQPIRFVRTESKGLFSSVALSTTRTWDGIVKTFEGYKKLVTNEVSLKSIGGPIAIGKVATDSFEMSLSYFFQIMAIISINLGIINLFPIPVLDGGHIMFIFLELVNRGPLSRRKLEIAQQFGLSLLLLLTFAALLNDFSRFF